MKKLFLTIIITMLSNTIFCLGSEYSLELQQAYNWAYKNQITTIDSIENANLKGGLNRIAMAKMLSYYAINVLGKAPNTEKYSECNFNDLTSDLMDQYNNGGELSCQLGIMGVGIKDFRPFDTVTRAEFGTALSRVLWGDKNEGGSTYYENHLKALKSEGIMTKIDNPTDKEVRGYVMLMLMRSNEPDYIQSYDDEDYIEYDDISYVIEMLD